MTNATLNKFAGESDLFYFDCTKLLADGETITGTPAMSFEPSSLTGGDALAFATAVVNGSPIQFPDGSTGKTGGVIVIRISGGTPASASAEREYTVIATFTTSLSNTKVARGRLLLLPLAL